MSEPAVSPDSVSAVPSHVPAPLARALERRGYHTLTPVQEAVLDPALAGRDLRISSRTGSGKTVALGLVLGSTLAETRAQQRDGVAHPRVLLIAPTRELAAQIGTELSWLYEDLRARVCVVTGGTSVFHETRSLARDPAVLVGTPGRLCDHLARGALDLSAVEAVVLDEADQMLDLGFREALETLLGAVPGDCRKHLVSATFPRSVHTLAARFQRDPAHVTGSAPDAAHEDIAHVVHLLAPRERYSALVNVLLLAPEERTLVFVRTRADAADVSVRLANDGFRAAALSGELAQAERTRTLEAFRKGTITVLVCTDVASRGIDVPDVGRVIHGDLPDNPEVLTHRSGRTGRAGKKGVSVMLVPESSRGYAETLLYAARVRARFVPAPSAADIERAAEARILEALTNDASETAPSELAQKLLERIAPEALVTALLARMGHAGPCAPRTLTPVLTKKPRFEPRPARAQHGGYRGAQRHHPAHKLGRRFPQR